ncbi:MAG: alpha-amylase/4-alpha-glucanotransferase domain-containing protein, partial [Candidatus Brocadiales bacterium]
MSQVHFVLVLHNHQPVGNLHGIFDRACTRAYEPFLKLLERHPEIPIVMHYSGSLLEWIEANRPALFEKIKSLVGRGQIELLGSGFYEPILGMLPENDCVGQICEYRDWLDTRLDADVRGIWLAERLWEQPLVKLIRKAGVEYTVVDDSHFKYAGLKESELYGYYLTKDGGETLKVFPCNERLRYAIPFKRLEETVECLCRAADTCEDALVVYADDGEKFGLWPNTFKHVYEKGWLEDFFGFLQENNDWIKLTTLSQVVDDIRPRGEVHLPDVSYREMMKWALPANASAGYADIRKTLGRLPQNDLAGRFAKGGSWRNFLVKYPEAKQMYTRMLEVSNKVSSNNKRSKREADAKRELYKAQCNDAYWHGIFGGLYLPHLRKAVFKHLLRAEAITDSHRGVRVETEDYDLDTTTEFKMTSPTLNAYFKPSRGGHLYELDYRPKGINLVNTLTRREEAYHRKLQYGKKQRPVEGARSIHELETKTKRAPEKQLLYDSYQKESLIDHFFSPGTGLKDFVRGRAVELDDFITLPYLSKVKRSRGKKILQLERSGFLEHGRKELPLKVTKTIEMDPVDTLLLITYCLENLSGDEMQFSFGVEFNLSMSAGKAPGRYYL